MPTTNVNGVELFYEDTGSGSETLFFSHGYLMTHEMYRAQIDTFQSRFRCIAYDHRGHGQSAVPEDGYDLDNLCADAIALIEALDIAPVHFVGMSTGGFVALRIALRRPDLIKSLILIDTSADAETSSKLREYNLMLTTIRTLGFRPVIGRGMQELFAEKFLKDPQRKAEVEKWRKTIMGQDRGAIVKFGKGIFARDSVVDQLNKITVPTVVLVGKHDVATPQTFAQQMADRIPDARLRIIPDAGHTTPVEKPQAVIDAMNLFFERVGIG